MVSVVSPKRKAVGRRSTLDVFFIGQLKHQYSYSSNKKLLSKTTKKTLNLQQGYKVINNNNHKRQSSKMSCRFTKLTTQLRIYD